jgi:hypothetical protein
MRDFTNGRILMVKKEFLMMQKRVFKNSSFLDD